MSIPFLAIVYLFDDSEYAIKGLKVTQDEHSITAKWKDIGVDEYEVYVFHGLGFPKRETVSGTSYSIHKADIGETYRIMVTTPNSKGNSCGAELVTIKTDKLKQKLHLSAKELRGFEGNTFDVTAIGKGKITFKSNDENVASVTDTGTVTLKKSGETTITVTAKGTDEYKDATKEVVVMSYPDSLGTTNVEVTDVADETVVLKWEPVQFATDYEILRYNIATDKYVPIKTVDGKSNHLKIVRTQGQYKVRATATINRQTIKGKQSSPVTIEAAANTAESYKKSHNIKTLKEKDLDTVALITGSGKTNVPQSMSFNGSEYMIAYVNHGGSQGKIITYNRKGKQKREAALKNMGHANGSTYNPNTGKIYVVKTHKSVKTKECSVYDEKQLVSESPFTLPKVTSGIAYDESNNKFYLSKGNEIYVTDEKFRVEKFIWKRIRYNHAQDIGAYNGVALVCTWVSGNTSYIDMYRVSDGAYLGSYYLPIGEIESCVVDDGYLVILMNKRGTSRDYIYKTKTRVAIP
ncbi:MAG: Ig-like domain-containing protein [Eubacterium sp.]|nr:Ig-like domain-containing protein [Candidatus Colimonas fimequi]